MRPYDSTSILEICSVWWYRITGKNEPNPEHIVFRQNFLKRPCVHKLSMDSQHPCQCEWTNMSASTKPSQWRAFTISDTKAYKKKSVNETSQMGYDKYPHEGKLRERKFTMVIHQKRKAIQISHGVVMKEILFNHYCATSTKGVARQ
jgi:hypothetical protein